MRFITGGEDGRIGRGGEKKEDSRRKWRERIGREKDKKKRDLISKN